jgi:glycosyltransferase involved in cell wall biosynthesis
MPVLSIIVPIYKVERYISPCTHSLFGQTHSDIEYIFVNDYTPDNSIKILLEVLKNYPDRSEQVKILNHEYNRGLAAARQSGLDAATGEYLIMVDSDDWLEIDMIAKMYEKAIKEDADIVIADFYEDYTGKEIYITHVTRG